MKMLKNLLVITAALTAQTAFALMSEQQATTSLLQAADHLALSIPQNYPKFKEAIQNHANVNAKDTPGNYAITYAAKAKCIRAVRDLIRENANLDVLDATRYTALMYAVMQKEYGIAQILIKAKANPNIADANKITPLIHAITNNDEKMVKMLLESPDIFLNQTDAHGSTPLMYAASIGNATIVTDLINAKADVHVKNNQGSTALSTAQRFAKQGKKGCSACVSALEKAWKN